jgi:hypothetical protein
MYVVLQVCYPCAVKVDAEATMDRVQWRLLRIKDHLQVHPSAPCLMLLLMLLPLLPPQLSYALQLFLT